MNTLDVSSKQTAIHGVVLFYQHFIYVVFDGVNVVAEQNQQPDQIDYDFVLADNFVNAAAESKQKSLFLNWTQFTV